MGSYLSTPITSKESENGSGKDGLLYGASAMQGWRVSQEDAHVTLPEFDEKAMLFAVFDGHGGSEVAKYAAMNLGQHIKSLDGYKKGNFQEALTEAFLSFDELLTQPHILDILRALAKDSSEVDSQTDNENATGEDDDSDGGEDGEDLAELLDEADQPIEDLLSGTSATSEQVRRILLDKRLDLKSLLMQHVAGIEGEDDSDDEDGENEQESTDEDMGDSEEEEGEAEVTAASKKEDAEPMKVEGNLVHPDDIVTQRTSAEVKLDHLLFDDQQSEKDQVKMSKSEKTPQQSGFVTSSTSEPEPILNGMSKQKDEVEEDASSTVSVAGSAVDDMSGQEKLRSVIIDDDQAAGPSTSTGLSSSVLNSLPDDVDSDKDYRPTEEIDSDDEDDDLDDNILQRLPPSSRRLLLAPGMFDFGESHTAVAGYDSGATACLAFIKENVLYVANVGDSRCVVSQNGQAIDMSIDHKPDDPVETARINRAGGKVTSDGRVNNGLNLSRALGDHNYKRNEELDLSEQMISAKPDVQQLTLDSSHDFMVIACDGIWNSLSSQEVVDFIRERLDNATANKTLSSICEELFSAVLAPNAGGDGTGMDNMTCVIIKLPSQYSRKEFPATAGSMLNGDSPVKLCDDQASRNNRSRQTAPSGVPVMNGNGGLKRTAEQAELHTDPQATEENTSVIKKTKVNDVHDVKEGQNGALTAL